MKKITILAIMMFGALGAFAQFNQGRMLVGGSGEFSTETAKSKSGGTSVTQGRWTSFSLSPKFGYFVIDNLAVGAGLGLTLAKWADDDDNDNDYTYTSIEFQPFVRYYLPQGIFFQGQVGIGSSKYNNDNNNEDKAGVASIALSAGYALFLSDNVAIEPLIGYRSKSLKDKETDVKDIDSGIFLQIGFQIYLGNKE